MRTTKDKVQRTGSYTPTDHLLLVVEIVSNETPLAGGEPEHEIVALCASIGDARAVAERWKLNDHVGIVAIFDLDTGEIEMVKGELL